VAPSITLPEKTLRVGSIELRPVSEADVSAFVEAFQDPAIAEGAYHGKIAATEEALCPYLQRNVERMEAGDGVLLGVWETGAEQLSGQTMLFNIDWDERTAELGFWIAPWSRGHGLSEAALRPTLEFGFDHLGIERVYGLTGVDNLAAHRAMERAGLKREGTLRGLEKTPSGRLDQVCFAILAVDART
jgi:RimJ/RimL family protein N-acetyltransferase